MSELVGKRKHLRSFTVGAVDEDQWRQGIHHREAPKLVGVEVPPIVIEYDAADHHEGAYLVGLVDEAAKSLGPGRTIATHLQIESQGAADCSRRLGRRRLRRH